MANCVLVQTGQCGNQLGYSLADSLNKHLEDDKEGSEVFFRYGEGDKKYLRAVCFDTEPKVVKDCLSKSIRKGQWQYDRKSIAFRHGGAGNNWALGYDMAAEESYLTSAMNCVRRELEFCDRAPSLVIMQSTAGGTGSGLGTRITEACADEFPETMRLNVTISPYHFGEVVVQHYNALLCLSKISAASHGVLLFENEVAQQLCKQMHGIERPTLADVNRTIVANILPLFLPKYRAGSASRSYEAFVFQDILHTCSHPSYQFLEMRTTPQTSKMSVDYTYDSWPTLLKTIQRMQMTGSLSERNLRNVQLTTDSEASEGMSSTSIRSFATSLSLHGVDAANAAADLNTWYVRNKAVIVDSNMSTSKSASSISSRLYNARVENNTEVSLGKHFLYSLSKTHHYTNTDAVSIRHSGHLVNGYQRTASLLSNSQAILPVLQRIALKSSSMYEVGAYLHQYKMNNIDQQDFVDAFHTLGSVIQNYIDL